MRTQLVHHEGAEEAGAAGDSDAFVTPEGGVVGPGWLFGLGRHRRVSVFSNLSLFSTPQWVVGHQALATSRRVERLSENRTVPTGCVRFANDHKLLYGNICSMSKTG